ncbi:MAG: acetyltransferase [Flavobacteriales bacterium]|nr:MAG: acetyltransferase [Flavobacteriales bacterium]
MDNTSDIVIYGAGGFGREVRSMLSAGAVKGYVDDAEVRVLSQNVLVLGNSEWLKNQSDLSVVLARGDGKDRRLMYAKIKDAHHRFPSIIHPSVIFQDKSSMKIGQGCVIGAGSIFTCDIQINNFVVINLNCTIGHDVVLESFVSLMPSVNLSGGVFVGEGTYIGSNATVLPNIRIGKNVIVGAGAVVTKDIPDNVIVKGIPAK